MEVKSTQKLIFFRFWGHERSVFQQSSILKHCTWSERLKKVHHVWVHLMNLYGLNWRSTWPLMNHPNNIPFRGPEAMCNQLVMLNLQKIEKKLKKIYVFEVLRLLEAKFQSFSFLYLNPILNGSSRWKNFFDPRCSSKDMTWVEGNFQELFSHWSMDLSQIGLQYHWGLGVSFPKWYDTCISDQKWPHWRPKCEE